jgi:hypothetical protein
LFAAGDPRRLAALRIGLCLIVAARLARPLFAGLGGQPEPLFRPRSFMNVFDAMPGRTVTIVVQLITVALLVAAAVGLGSRIALPLGWIGAMLLFGMENSVGKVIHHDVLPLLAMIPLLPAPTDPAWSIRPARRPVDWAVTGWPVRTAGVLVAGVYLIAGIVKLVLSGPAWVLGPNLRHVLYTASDAHGGNTVALFVADRPILASAVAAGALLFELTLWIALARPRLAPVFVLWAAALHTGIWLTIGINYVSWAITVAVVLIDWPAIVDRLASHPVAEPEPAVR